MKYTSEKALNFPVLFLTLTLSHGNIYLNILLDVPPWSTLTPLRLAICGGVRKMAVAANAILPAKPALPSETVPVENAVGRILGFPSVGCPPAVLTVICGERSDENAIAVFR
jgi:hypothetical protein